MALWEGYWSWDSSHDQRCQGGSSALGTRIRDQNGINILSYSLYLPPVLLFPFSFYFCFNCLPPQPSGSPLCSSLFSAGGPSPHGRQMSTGNTGLIFYFREVRGKRTLSVSFTQRIPKRLVWLVSWTDPRPSTVTREWECKSQYFFLFYQHLFR